MLYLFGIGKAFLIDADTYASADLLPHKLLSFLSEEESASNAFQIAFCGRQQQQQLVNPQEKR